jgi:glutathione S-transferase
MNAGFTLVGRPGTGSGACEAVLALSGLPFTVKDIATTADGSVPAALLALNPLGQVPVLVLPDGSVMTESAAIVLYIADLSQSRALAPAIGDPDRAAYLRIMLFMAANNYMTELRVYYPHRFSMDPAHAAAVKAKALEEKALQWRVLEANVNQHGHLAGKALGAADVYMAMLANWAEDWTGFSQSHPRLAELCRRVAESPAVAPVWLRHGFSA